MTDKLSTLSLLMTRALIPVVLGLTRPTLILLRDLGLIHIIVFFMETLARGWLASSLLVALPGTATTIPAHRLRHRRSRHHKGLMRPCGYQKIILPSQKL